MASEKRRGCGALLRRLVFIGLLLAFVGLVVLWFARNAIAGAVFDRVLPQIVDKASAAGVELIDFESDPIYLPSPSKIVLGKVRTDFDLGEKNEGALRSRFEATELGIGIAGFFPLEIRLEARDFSLHFHPEDLPEEFPFSAFEKGYFRSGKLPAKDPKAAARTLLDGVHELFHNNETEGDFRFEGIVKVAVGQGSLAARLYTEVLAEGKARLRFDADDIRQLAEASGVVLAEDEIELLSLYPLRVPEIVTISIEAKGGAAARKARDSSFPDDAFRHVTWSHGLTKSFGAEFAKMVTDAHETLPNNTADERAMDYHNNAIGRELAEKGVGAGEIERLVLTSPDIIRAPEEVAGRSDLRK